MADIDCHPLDAGLIAVKAALQDGETIARTRQAGLEIEVQRQGMDLWTVLRRRGAGGLALRMPLFDAATACDLKESRDRLELTVDGTVARVRIALERDGFGLEQFRLTLRAEPRQPLALKDLGRDLYPLDAYDDPTSTKGKVEACQRRLNTGLVYFSLDEPAFGKVLYVQNLTALNDYFRLTETIPEDAVGGEWPELGYKPPVNKESGKAVLPEGQEVTLFDTILVIRRYPEEDEASSAWQFLDMLGAAWQWLGPPPVSYRDWVGRADDTVRDLAEAPAARIRHWGLDYFHPYTSSEYPDVMVQSSLLSALVEWTDWRGDTKHRLAQEILAGLDKFYDPELKTMRRYLPNVGPDKDADAVDSWYLYHPLMNMANVALRGDMKARKLFLDSIDYGIEAARHFKYKWPIMYNVKDFSVIRAVAEADQRGQTDVGGIYAWVMLQAFELTRDTRFLDEAVAAIEAAKGQRFDLNYQANLTAWGAVACIRLWRITGEKSYLEQSYVYLASFFHNSQIWKSDIALAKHYTNFMGVTCLQDAPYMAAYECFDSYAAFERYMDLGGPDLIPSVRLLVGEYCRYALDRAWFYYPDALPEDAIADKSRNGYIDCALNFPLEDLYPDGQQAGQVGQEIYGAGAALIYCTRAFKRFHDAPFLMFSDHFVRADQRFDDNTASFRLDGLGGCRARLILRFEGEPPAPETVGLRSLDGCDFAWKREGDRLCTEVPANGSFLIRWSAS